MLDSLLHSFGDPASRALRSEVVLVLASVAKTRAADLLASWDAVDDVLAVSLEGRQPLALKLHAVRCLQNVACSEARASLEWWTAVIDRHLLVVCGDEFHAVRSAAHGALAALQPALLARLDVPRLKRVLAVVLAGAEDPNDAVRISALATLGSMTG